MPLTRIQKFSILFAFVMIIWGLNPFFNFGNIIINDNLIASSTILILIGIAYPLIIFKRNLKIHIILIEGIIFAFIGFAFLKPLGNLFFILLGIILVIISILTYLGKLPKPFLKFFYKNH